MFLSFRRRKTKILRLDRDAVEDLVLHFEASYEEVMGERLPSAEFYVRYRRGEFDQAAAMMWASMYEALQRMPEGQRRSTRRASQERAPIIDLVDKTLPRVAV